MCHAEARADFLDAVAKRRLIGVEGGVIKHNPLKEPLRLNVRMLLAIYER